MNKPQRFSQLLPHCAFAELDARNSPSLEGWGAETIQIGHHGPPPFKKRLDVSDRREHGFKGDFRQWQSSIKLDRFG